MAVLETPAGDARRKTRPDFSGLFGALDGSIMMLRVVDLTGLGLYFSDAWLAFTGTRAADLSGERWLEVVHRADTRAWQEALDKCQCDRSELNVEYRVRWHDGSFRWIFERGAPWLEDGEFKGYASVCFDVTEHHESDERLRLGGELYHQLAETIPALVLTTSGAGDVQYCNARLLEYCGTDIAGLQGTRWVEYIHPDDVASGREVWERRLRTLAPFRSEYRIRRYDGAYRWHLTQTAPLRSESGRIQAWIGVSVDVHDRREAEQRIRDVADELRKANAAKDEFLGLVSHELRTPITTIYGNSQVLRRMQGKLDAETLASAVADIEQESIRLQQLIDNMFVLARIEGGQPLDTEPVLLGRIVAKAVASHSARHVTRTIEVMDDAGDVPVRGSPIYVDQALRNLLSNAEKYSSPDQAIEVQVDRSDNQVAVRVLDRGIGLSEGTEGRAFEIFYRAPEANERSQGAGIGLAVVRRLIEAQGGEVWLRARAGGGAEAGFTLPLEVEEEA